MALKLDEESRSLLVDEKIIRLSPTQFRLMQALLPVGTVRTYESLLDALGMKSDGKLRLHAHVSRLRRRLTRANLIVQAVPDVGYVLLRLE